jgi:hypothetical protein
LQKLGFPHTAEELEIRLLELAIQEEAIQSSVLTSRLIGGKWRYDKRIAIACGSDEERYAQNESESQAGKAGAGERSDT